MGPGRDAASWTHIETPPPLTAPSFGHPNWVLWSRDDLGAKTYGFGQRTSASPRRVSPRFFFFAAVMTWVPSLMVVSVGARFAASYFAAVMIRASGGSQTGVDRDGVALGPLLSRTGRGARFAASYFAAVMIWAPNPMDWSSETA